MQPSTVVSAHVERSTPAPDAAAEDAANDASNWGKPASREQPLAHHSTPHQGVILIVENEENNRRLVEQILDFAGYSYRSATNGIEALEILGRERVDVVLIDLSMPILDGYRTTQLIRQRPDCSALPIVAVTAHAMSEDRELALRAGCTDYLAKPFHPTELLSVVARMLAGATN